MKILVEQLEKQLPIQFGRKFGGWYYAETATETYYGETLEDVLTKVLGGEKD